MLQNQKLSIVSQHLKNRRPPQVRNQICQGTVDDLLFIQADLETIVCGPIEEGNNVAF